MEKTASADNSISSYLPKMFETDGGLAPESPANIAATGISKSLLSDMVLKTAYGVSNISTESTATRLHLPQVIVGEILEQLRAESMLETMGHDGPFGYRYAISQRGRERAERMLEISGYVGPAPVSLEAYRAMLEWQMSKAERVSEAQVEEALKGLVLPIEVKQVAGLAISSGRSLFLSGPAGNGKTSLGRQLHAALRGDIWIPHCIAVENNIIRLFDPHCHQVVEHASKKLQTIDKRWIKIKRPFIVAGGEMTLESLDMAYLKAQRYYEAPLHMKANGGTFLIDDFGRQHVAPEELLNRWIIPLEHRVDFLTLNNGQKIEVPFLLNLIIATNLNPSEVTDPAFLRRIGYRTRLSAPTAELYRDIFTSYANSLGVAAPPELITRLLQRYVATGRELRACEPRDLIERVRDICTHRQQPLSLNAELLDLAWNGYFGTEANAA